jgi:hypothetical protein
MLNFESEQMSGLGSALSVVRQGSMKCRDN